MWMDGMIIIGHRSSRAPSVLIKRKSVKAISNISKNLDDSTIKKSYNIS